MSKLNEANKYFFGTENPKDVKKLFESQSSLKQILRKYKLKYNHETGLYDCDRSLMVPNDLVSNGRFIINFGVIRGRFYCGSLNLTSLEGAPKEVSGDFICSNNRLKSLEGAPEKVGGSFGCSFNELTSLKGLPLYSELDGGFDCSYNKIKSLKGAPKKVWGGFICMNNELVSLSGAPKEVIGNFNCSDNKKLISLKGSPKIVAGKFDCSNCSIEKLEYVPKEVGWANSDTDVAFDCSCNKLTTLEGSPKIVHGTFMCCRNGFRGFYVGNDNKFIYDEKHFYSKLPKIIEGGLVGGPECDLDLAEEYCKIKRTYIRSENKVYLGLGKKEKDFDDIVDELEVSEEGLNNIMDF